MAYSTQREVSDGTLTDIRLTIEFIDRVDINVFVNDIPKYEGVDWDWVNDTLYQFRAPVAAGLEVLTQRNTALDGVLNVFVAGASFDDPTMDENFRQMLYIAQEAKEGATLEEIFNNLNMHGYRIQNLGAGTEPGDAINYQQYVDDAAGAGAARIAAEAARDAAITARNTAQGAATTATTQAGLADTARIAAESASSTAVAQVSLAQTARAAAEAARDAAQGYRDSAAGSATTADTARIAAQAAAAAASSSLLPMFGVIWWPLRSSIPAGFAAADGQVLSRASYPDAWGGVNTGKVPVATDATWLSTATERGKYTAGDGSTTFRLPDYNGVYAGSIGSLFLRGTGGTGGSLLWDAMQGHAHLGGNRSNDGVTPDIYGAEVATSGRGVSASSGNVTSQPKTGPAVTDGTNGVPRVGAETMPKHVTGVWIVKLFGAAVDVGTVNVTQLAADVIALTSRVTTAEGKVTALETARTAGRFTTEVLWSGNVGSAGVDIPLSRPIVEGDMLVWEMNDANHCITHPTLVLASNFVVGRLWFWANPGPNVSFQSTTLFRSNTFVSGYGVVRLMALKWGR